LGVRELNIVFAVDSSGPHYVGGTADKYPAPGPRVPIV
jgi:hypothetical protein